MTPGPLRSPHPSRRTLCVGGMALACAWRLGDSRAAGVPAQVPDWLPAPVLPDVALQDQDGHSVRLQHDLIEGRTVIVNFMFTGCQAVCPPQTALLREALQRIGAQPGLREVRVVSITVDPLGDGPAQLRAFGQRYALPTDRSKGREATWTLLTGRPADVARVLLAFDVPASAPGEHPGLLWLGDAVRGRWTRTSSLNAPDTLVALLQALRQ